MASPQLIPTEFAERRWRPLSRHLRERFGAKVYRVTVDAGFTCPNVDGTVAKGGCVYCDNESFSPNRRLPRRTLREQVAAGIDRVRERHDAEKFLVYFQAATNTWAPLEKLRRLYDEAIDHPAVSGLIIGTRPDCVGDPVLDLLESYASRMYVSLELGLQTIHDSSLEWMNRGHGFASFVDAVERCEGRALELCAHVILGLPGESHADMMATAEVLGSLPIHAAKVHNLHVVRDTPMAVMHERGEVRMLEFGEYVSLMCDFLERLPPHVVLQRLNGDAPPKYLVAPAWCLDKAKLLAAIQSEFVRRDSWQGKRWNAEAGRERIENARRRRPLSLAKSSPSCG
jgi:radical SAM protein (TIGR01212 family)